MSDLNDILEGSDEPLVEAVEPQQEPEAPEQPQEAEQAEGGQPRGPDGKFAPKGEDSAPPAQEDNAEAGLKAAAAAERKKRQEAEQRYQDDIEALRRELAELKQPKEPEAPPPSMWEDEQGWKQHFGSQVTQQAVQAAAMQSRLHTSELLMMQSAEDFNEIKVDIHKFIMSNPALVQEVDNSPHPWQTAYKAFKNHQTMQQLGTTDLEEMKAKMREELMAEMKQTAAPNIPQSLADAQSSKSGGQPQATNLSLDDILRG